MTDQAVDYSEFWVRINMGTERGGISSPLLNENVFKEKFGEPMKNVFVIWLGTRTHPSFSEDEIINGNRERHKRCERVMRENNIDYLSIYEARRQARVRS